jgi:hypothetical protein
MVDEKDDPFPKKSRALSFKDKDGIHYLVAAEPRKTGTSPKVDVWWNRGPRKRVWKKIGANPLKQHTEQEEEIIIRQENGRVGADVIILTPGQTYDLIDALCRAVENP